MTAQILDGKKIAQTIRQNLKTQIAQQQKTPHLAVILAGNNQAGEVYVRNKLKAAEETGIKTTLLRLPENVSESEMSECIAKLNQDTNIHGIMIQLPLPKHLDERRILNEVLPQKDVDGFHPYNIGRLQNNDMQTVIAATPKGIMRLLQSTGINLTGKNALIIGRSQIVGKPTAMLLLNADCTVTVAHSHTKNLAELATQADIIVAACGCPKLVQKSWIKKGAVLIDVGINHLDGKLCGDIDFEAAKEIAGFITPVPGGVGPMTVAMLLENTFEACLKQTATPL